MAASLPSDGKSASAAPPVTLPPAASDAGAVARLLLAENLSPYRGGYNAAQCLLSMQWMRLVLENRLDNHPAQFGAPNGTTLTDIIRAPGQFAGFGLYPILSNGVAKLINDDLEIANAKSHPRKSAFTAFIEAACSVARADFAVEDPCRTGLYGWRTISSGSPGPRFSAYANVAGNTFYTLDT